MVLYLDGYGNSMNRMPRCYTQFCTLLMQEYLFFDGLAVLVTAWWEDYCLDCNLLGEYFTFHRYAKFVKRRNLYRILTERLNNKLAFFQMYKLRILKIPFETLTYKQNDFYLNITSCKRANVEFRILGRKRKEEERKQERRKQMNLGPWKRCDFNHFLLS